MNPSRLFLLAIAGCCLFQSRPLRAQAATAPFDVSKQYSADTVITPQDGTAMTQKLYSDNGKVRSEMNISGRQMISILRPDLKKVYTVLVAQKMVMESPYDPDKYPVPGSPATDSRFEVVGPDQAEGIACTKYKMTGKDGRVVFYWVDTSKKELVKMMPEDGAVTIIWKNFVAGPQDATLFDPPAGYRVIPMPAAPTMPGAPGANGQ